MFIARFFTLVVLLLTAAIGLAIPDVGCSQEGAATSATTKGRLENGTLLITTGEPANGVLVQFYDGPKLIQERDKAAKEWRFKLPEEYTQDAKVSVEVGAMKEDKQLQYGKVGEDSTQSVDAEKGTLLITTGPANAVRVQFDDSPTLTQKRDKAAKEWRFRLPEEYTKDTKVSVEVGTIEEDKRLQYGKAGDITVPRVEPEISAELQGQTLLIRINGLATDVQASLKKKDGEKWKRDATFDPGLGAWKLDLPSDVDLNSKVIASFTFYGESEEQEVSLWLKPPPHIEELKPNAGGEPGAFITIVGKNFGLNRSDIKITLRDERDSTQTWEAELGSITNPNLDEEGKQELSFAIPKDSLNKKFWRNNTRLSVEVSGQRSNEPRLTVLSSYWQFKCAGLSVVLVVVVITIVVWSVRRNPMFRDKWRMVFFFFFLDRKSNKYSLSKFQAFGWTALLLASYFYLALGKGLMVGALEIPDFNPSLVVLMSVSYGGLIVSRGLANRNARNDLEGSPRRLSNLFTEGGEVSLPRLQLFGFTIIAWIVYAGYMVFSVDVFAKGLPDVPQNLLALLGVSQGGYVGGRAVAGRLAVNLVVPRRINIDYKKDIEVILTGSGFVDEMKAMFGNDNRVRNTVRRSENILKIELPYTEEESKRPAGWNKITLIPPQGASILVEKAVQFVDPRIVKATVSGEDKKTLTLRLRGFSGDDVVCKVNNKLLQRDPDDLELGKAQSASKLQDSDEEVTAVFKSENSIEPDKDILVYSADLYVTATQKTPPNE